MSAGHAILAACLLALACPPAGAELFRYRVNRPTVDMLLSGELTSNESKSATTSNKTETMTTSEKFDIRTAGGWIYHPALLTFSAGLQPEFQQRQEESGSGGSKALGTFLGFDLDASVLPYKPYTLDLYASQNRSEYKSTLASDQASESSTYRARLKLKEYMLPTTFTLESLDRTSESFYTTREKKDLAKLESRHQSESSDTRLDAEFQERLIGVSGNETESQQFALRARNLYQLSAASTINSNFRRADDNWSGKKTAQTSLGSSMAVQHHEKLSTSYDLSFDNSSGSGYSSSTGTAGASLQHQLYENLATTLSGNASKSETNSGVNDSYGGAINLAYNRSIPWGHLNASVGHTETVRDWQQLLPEALGNEIPTVTKDQPWVELGQLYVNTGSIEVRNSDTNFLYTEGSDYSVVTIGRNVLLDFNFDWLDPAFASGSVPIRVDYRYETQPSAKTRSVGNSFGVGVNLWSMLGLNYSWNGTQAKLLSGTLGTGDTQDRSMQMLVASLKLGWRAVKSTTATSVTEEKIAADEWAGGRGAAVRKKLNLNQSVRIGKWSTTTFGVDDTAMSGDSSASSQSSTQTQYAKQIFIYQPTRHMSISVGANYSGIEYKETGDRSKSSGYDARMRWQVGAGMLSANAYSNKTQGHLQETMSTGLRADYEWRYGPWRSSVQYSLAEEESLRQNALSLPGAAKVSSKRTKNVLYFELKRMFQ